MAGLPAADTEPLPANTKILRVAGRRLLVCCPNQVQFGHFGVEIAYALAYARLLRLPVAFVRAHAPRVGHTLFEIDTDEVRIVRSFPLRSLARLWWLVTEHWWRRTVVTTMRREMIDALSRHERQHPRLPKSVRSEIRARAREMKMHGAKRSSMPAGAGYNRRQLLATPVHTFLRTDAAAHAAELAAAAGIKPDAKIACVHVRERGFKIGAEMQDKGVGAWDDSVRNARIETHFAAMDLLVERGYTVVRIGDPSMTPVDRPGVIDLATSPKRHPLLDLHCLVNGRLLLCGESGPYSVSFLTNTPLLAVNCTDPVGAFPVRSDGIYLLKTVVARATGTVLTGSALVTPERLQGLRNTTTYEFVENTANQIRDAVEEMLDLLDNRTPESLAQAWYRELATAAGVAAQDMNYVHKHGPDRGYLGTGRLARSQAEPWAQAEAEVSVLTGAARPAE